MPRPALARARALCTRSLGAATLCAALTGCPEAPPRLNDHLPGGDTTNTFMLGGNAFIRPAENLEDAHQQAFYAGNSLFNMPWVEAPASTTRRDGLGPLFNARSCAACHFRDGRGAPPEGDEAFLGLLVRLSVPGLDPFGGPLPDPNYGGQLQPFAITGVPAEANPRVTYTEIPGTYDDGEPYTLLAPVYTFEELAHGPLHPDVMTSPRVAPPVIGLGLLEAIPDDRLHALADPDDGDGDGVSGRINRVWDVEAGALRVGRFGWKADQPSVRQQTAGALLGDMGITSPVFRERDCAAPQADCLAAMHGGADADTPEIEAADFDKLVLYTRLLAVPIRRDHGAAEVEHGQVLFHEAGCVDCHVPSHVTGEHPLPEVTGQRIWPYTDLLLHDMGDGLADGRPVFDADGREWRTPPLWGIGLYEAVNGHQRLLHDGRARGVAEAILWHGGEAEAAREAFRKLPAADRAALVRFVESL